LGFGPGGAAQYTDPVKRKTCQGDRALQSADMRLSNEKWGPRRPLFETDCGPVPQKAIIWHIDCFLIATKLNPIPPQTKWPTATIAVKLRYLLYGQ
jgi:hypothetical protein